MHKRREPIDLGMFPEGPANASVKYGLPKEVRICASCAISNRRPNTRK